MKQSESNPLQRELAQSPVAGPHPEADILTAFAEGKLLQRERAEVFAHLATCSDCREVLAVAAEAAPLSASGTKPFLLPRSTHKPLRTWLPWASIAAGIIVVCSAGLLYKQKLEFKSRATVANENPPAVPIAAAPRPQSSPSAKPTVAHGKTSTGPIPATLKAPTLAKGSIVQKPESQNPSSSSLQAELRQQNSTIENSATAEVTTDAKLARPSVPAPASSAFVGAAPPRGMAQASIAGVARPHWRINSNGQVERSFGNEAWETVLPNEDSKMRVVSVFNGNVWIGGENSRLYHSADNGFTWSLVSLPEKDGHEHAIAHIRFQSSQAGTVEAADGAIWTTADGGASWN
jgi:hypothetical protein